ncbi:hypothetical protein ABGB17_05970 [Sphaerisporangium sp. B11E5]|uniref:hypothetical protein n=1 Tax=Sphaerisporangium sp. B11E5 TaxID=3153563 RepID=UPI00325F68E5
MLALTVLVAVVAIVAWGVDPGAGNNFADLAGVALTAAAAMAAVVAWLRRGNGPASEVNPDDAANVLAALVRDQWRTEARLRAVDSPEPIPVIWQLSANTAVMSKPRLISDDPEPVFTGSSADIADMARRFRSLKRRRLVITGGPGTGKTTLAVQLLLRLLETREADKAAAGDGETVPVPVLLPVSGWDTGSHPRLQDWLTVRLVQDYPALSSPRLGAGVAGSLVARGYILPVLDGLDEIPGDRRADVIKALNDSLGADDQLVLTSRSREFATAVPQAGQALHGAAVITPKLLTSVAAVAYLEACLPGRPSSTWRTVLDAIVAGTVPGLATAVSTPLGLWLIRTVYIGTGADPSPLVGPLGEDHAALRAHMMDHLVPALLQARPPSAEAADHFRPRRRWDPVAVRRYLRYLARVFPPDVTRDIAWWHLARTLPGFRSAAGVATALVNVVLHGLLLGQGMGILVAARLGAGRWPYAAGTATLIGMVVGLVFGAVFGLRVGLPELRPGAGTEPDRATRSRVFLRRLVLRVAIGTPLGLVVYVLIGVAAGGEPGTRPLGITLGLAAGLAVVFASAGRWDHEEPGYADLSLRRGAALRGLGRNLARWLVIGLKVGLMFELLRLGAVLSYGTAGSLLLIAVGAGLAAGFVTGVVRWAEEPALVSIMTPRLSWRSDRTLTMVRMLMLGLILAVLLTLLFWSWLPAMPGADVAVGTTLFVSVGLAFGMVLGLTSGRHHAWLAFAVAAGTLALRRKLPWRLMGFLEDAHRLGVLRTVGPIYQFRHAQLHDHLSGGPGTAPVPGQVVVRAYDRVPEAE